MPDTACEAAFSRNAIGPLEQLVRKTLATRCHLLPDETQTTVTPIVRGGVLCGLHFAVHGPRRVMLTAVWDAASETLWCYGSSGERFLAIPTGDAATDDPGEA